MSNVIVTKKPKNSIVPMYDMKHGQIGRVLASGTRYDGDIVKANILEETITVMSLSSVNSFWVSKSIGEHGGYVVEILEPGIEVTITVPDNRED